MTNVYRSLSQDNDLCIQVLESRQWLTYTGPWVKTMTLLYRSFSQDIYTGPSVKTMTYIYRSFSQGRRSVTDDLRYRETTKSSQWESVCIATSSWPGWALPVKNLRWTQPVSRESPLTSTRRPSHEVVILLVPATLETLTDTGRERRTGRLSTPHNITRFTAVGGGGGGAAVRSVFQLLVIP